MRIWGKGYRPFIMGGDVNAYVSCDVPDYKPIDAGKGFQVCVVVSSCGRKKVIVEASTGAIVGYRLREVKKDIEEGDIEYMNQQIKEASLLINTTVHLSETEFFQSFTAARIKR